MEDSAQWVVLVCGIVCLVLAVGGQLELPGFKLIGRTSKVLFAFGAVVLLLGISMVLYREFKPQIASQPNQPEPSMSAVSQSPQSSPEPSTTGPAIPSSSGPPPRPSPIPPQIGIAQPTHGSRVPALCEAENSCYVEASGSLDSRGQSLYAYLLIAYDDGAGSVYYVQWASTYLDTSSTWSAQAYVDAPSVEDPFLLQVVLTRNELSSSGGGLQWTSDTANQADVVTKSAVVRVVVGEVRLLP